METRFAVVDVETTGLFPGGTDRIIEIGIVCIDEAGEVCQEYETLLNPNRDLGPSQLHGIEARDVIDAPTFGEVCGDLVPLIKDAYFVGHNANFDFRFLQAEFDRSGYRLPPIPCVCTISLALKTEEKFPSRRLEDMCAYFNIVLPEAHRAIDDARATAQLFMRCRAIAGTEAVQNVTRISRKSKSDSRIEWPNPTIQKKPYPRSSAISRRNQTPSYISSIVKKLPPGDGTPHDWQPYFDLIDRVLEDRRITSEEAALLESLALDSGLSRTDALIANEAYLSALLDVVLADGIISPTEQKDIEEVHALLGKPTPLSDIIERNQTQTAHEGHSQNSAQLAQLPLEEKTVCFTGEFRASVRGALASRSFAEKTAAEHGMIVKKGVTKNLDYLVMADPDSMSGKAKKARKYGTRILAETVFWNLMGEDTD